MSRYPYGHSNIIILIFQINILLWGHAHPAGCAYPYRNLFTQKIKIIMSLLSHLNSVSGTSVHSPKISEGTGHPADITLRNVRQEGKARVFGWHFGRTDGSGNAIPSHVRRMIRGGDPVATRFLRIIRHVNASPFYAFEVAGDWLRHRISYNLGRRSSTGTFCIRHQSCTK